MILKIGKMLVKIFLVCIISIDETDIVLLLYTLTISEQSFIDLISYK